MKLLVLSDLHLEFSDLAVPAGVDFDVAILAGDIACPGTNAIGWARRQPPLAGADAAILVPGNHEYYDAVMQNAQRAMREAAQDSTAPPMHLLDCDRVDIGCGPTSRCASTPATGCAPIPRSASPRRARR